MTRIAIHPDAGGEGNTSCTLWRATLEAADCEVRTVDVFGPPRTLLRSLEGIDGFMWRFVHGSADLQVARRVFPVIESELGIPCFPDAHTRWHFDDKVAQAYAMLVRGVPAPETNVFFRREDAQAFARTATYPLVIKLAGGAGSTSVRLVHDRRQAETWIRRLFLRGMPRMPSPPKLPRTMPEVRGKVAEGLAKVGLWPASTFETWEWHRAYVLFQEFLPDNPFDTRVTVIGDRAFAFRRFNRPNDFRSSGSGLIDHDIAAIDLETVRLAFDTADRLRMQSCAIDGLRRGEMRVVGEVCYTYKSNAVHDCPGHWDRDLNWHEGQMWPEHAQATDFLARVRSRAA